MNHAQDIPAYGLWSLVVINSAVFIIFAFSFFKPRTKRDWRTFGGFSAFIWRFSSRCTGSRSPSTSHRDGSRKDSPASIRSVTTRAISGIRYWASKVTPLNPIHIASNLFILAGFLLLSASWKVLFNAQRDGRLATTRPYSWVRHPQYAGFIAIMTGFLLQWPTVITLIMFPILVTAYLRLARREEAGVRAVFGQAWDDYAARTPAFVPRFHRPGTDSLGAERRAQT